MHTYLTFTICLHYHILYSQNSIEVSIKYLNLPFNKSILLGEIVTEIFGACDHVRRHFKNFLAPSFTLFRASFLFGLDRYFTFLWVRRDRRTGLLFRYGWLHEFFQGFYNYGIVRFFELRLLVLIGQVLVGDMKHYIFRHIQSLTIVGVN